MSKLMAFSVHDQAAAAFLRPFFTKTRGQAVRGFSDAVNDAKHEFHAHPEDYTLFYIGEFDEDKGELKASVPESLGNALTFMESEK